MPATSLIQRIKIDWPFLAILAVLTVVFFSGLASAPFHPDESTIVYMSADVDRFIQAPSQLFWQPDPVDPLAQKYRQLDAPLGRTLIGLGRLLTGTPALAADWNWSLTWNENQQAGALPSPELLLTGRASVAWLFPFSLLFLYMAARRTAGRRAAWISALLLAGNALILLHTRRAMAESGLVFAVSFSIWTLSSTPRRPWLAALPIGLAFCAKHSSFPLVAVGLVAALFPLVPAGSAKRIFNGVLYLILLIGLVFLMNPILWSNPLNAAGAVLQSRQELLGRQVEEARLAAPGLVLDDFSERLVAMIGGAFIIPPSPFEFSNYNAELQPSIDAYLSNPLHSLFTGNIGGTILLACTLGGMLMGIIQLVKLRSSMESRAILLIALATISLIVGILISVPLGFQRYYVPLVPFICFWSGVFLSETLKNSGGLRRLAGG